MDTTERPERAHTDSTAHRRRTGQAKERRDKVNKQKKGLKTLLVLLIALAMVIGMLPASALAETAEAIGSMTQTEESVTPETEGTEATETDATTPTEESTAETATPTENDATLTETEPTEETATDASVPEASNAVSAESAAADAPAANAAARTTSDDWENYSDFEEHGIVPVGTTVNLFNYSFTNVNDGINANHAFKFGGLTGDYPLINQWNGGGINSDIVEDTLDASGYPKLKGYETYSEKIWNDYNQNGREDYGEVSYERRPALEGDAAESLSYLFDPNIQNSGKESYSDVGGLFLTDSDGYYYYNSMYQSRKGSGSQWTKQNNFKTANYAAYDETSNSFHLYNTWGVQSKDGNQLSEEAKGQFYPFDGPEEVFNKSGNQIIQNLNYDVRSTNDYQNGGTTLDYFFGLTMTTQFVQQYNGHTDEQENKDVTYEFSGDDDVWIFIDDVLVADLGGTHNVASVKMNFADGTVTITDNGVKDQNPSTFKEIFTKAKPDVYNDDDFNGGTFKNDTYHTLKFFYLERGAGNSNLSLKFNLAAVPASDIIKIDQLGDYLSGVKFNIYETGNDYDYSGKEEYPDYTGITNTDGQIILTKEDGSLVRLAEIFENNCSHLVIHEDGVHSGYRGTGDMKVRLEKVKHGDSSYVIALSDNMWETGAYAMAGVQASSSPVIEYYQDASDPTPSGKANLNDETSGIMFAVPMKYKGSAENVGSATAEDWLPIYGDPVDGWHTTANSSMENVVIAAQEDAKAGRDHVFQLSQNNYVMSYQDLPGDITKYYYMLDGNEKEQTQFSLGYFYTTAKDITGASRDNTYRVESDDFERIFSTRLYIPNIANNLIVQKVDQAGNPVTGAEFTLYSDESCQTVAAGIGSGATVTTADLNKNNNDAITLQGAAIFSKIPRGTYYLKESKAPEGYKPSTDVTKIVVNDTGVLADAGTGDDDVKVIKGVGSIVKSMVQFAVDDPIDVSLHNVTGTVQKLKDDIPEPEETYNPANWIDGESISLEYAGADDKNATLEYSPATADGAAAIVVDEGWSRMKVTQTAKDDSTAYYKDIANYRDSEGVDLTNLFSISTTVQVKNDKIGDLTISKDVTGLDPQESDSTAFTFKVTLSGKVNTDVTYKVNDPSKVSVNGQTLAEGTTEGSVTVPDDGIITITLKDDGNVTFEDVYGQDYKVEETGVDSTDYKTSWTATDGDKKSSSASPDQSKGESDTVVSGTVPEGSNSTVAFTNEKLRDLTISKVVSGSYGDTTKEFTFNISLMNGGQVVNGTYTCTPGTVDGTNAEVPSINSVEFTNGTANVQLKHGQTITIHGLPTNTVATVTETDDSRQGYTTTYTNSDQTTEGSNEGNSAQETLNSNDNTIAFTNTLTSVPSTGSFFDNNATNVLMVIASIAILALAALGIWRYKRTHA